MEFDPCFGNHYCCETSDGNYECCDLADYLRSKSLNPEPLIASSLVVGLLIILCICCLCCPCCMLYKRRHRGTVYGRVLQPGMQTTVTVSQQSQPNQPYPTQVIIPKSIPPSGIPMPGQPTAMPTPGYHLPYPINPVAPANAEQHPPPPPYDSVVNEMYSRQAPYNPNY